MADDGITITIEGKQYALDDFSLGDLEWLEDHIGGPLFVQENLQSMKAMVGFVYLIRRRDDPNFTMEQARETKLAALDQPADEEESPTTRRSPSGRKG